MVFCFLQLKSLSFLFCKCRLDSGDGGNLAGGGADVAKDE